MPLWLFPFFLAGTGCLSGLISTRVRHKLWPGKLLIITTAMSCCLWWLMARSDAKPLSVMSVLFDVSIQVGFYGSILYLGEPLSLRGAIGVLLAVSGCILMTLGA